MAALLALPLLVGAGGLNRVTGSPLNPFALRTIDPCFYAALPGQKATWPFAISARDPERSAFNDPRTLTHIGVDIWAPRNQATVHAMQGGTIHDVRPDHFLIGPAGHTLAYWHVHLFATLHGGSVVHQGQPLGRVFANYWHVHISEESAGCDGLIDPRRPTGPLYDPRNNEQPVVGPISAYVANTAAYPHATDLTIDPATRRDPSTRLPQTSLHGRVDFRASVTDTPRTTPPVDPTRGAPFPEHAQTPAAIRGWLAPAGSISRHIGSVWRFNGAHHLLSADVYRFWAFGTYRSDACYYHWTDPSATCAQTVVWHVAGLGFDTHTVPNGHYLYCVQAITDASVKAMRCLGVTIAN